MVEGLARKALRENGITGITVDSAGVDAIDGLPTTPDTLHVMKAKGVDLSSYRSKRFVPDPDSDDSVLAMTKGQKEKILADFPPRREGVHAERVCQELIRGCLRPFQRPSELRRGGQSGRVFGQPCVAAGI